VRKSSKKESRREAVLLTFLQQTKSGKYAKITTSSLPSPRINEQPEPLSFEEEYFYSIS
jgi:hypothetical protein